MNNGIKIALRLFIGAVFVFLVGYMFINGNLNIDLSAFYFPASLILVGIGAVLLVYSVYLDRTIRKAASQEMEGEEEDRADKRMYRQYSDASLANSLSMIISLTALSIMVITAQPAWLVFSAIAVLLLSLMVSMVLPSLIKRMYPDRNFPSISDSNYAEKLLKMSDDGERHVMLGGLYKTYLSMNSLLFGAIFLLLFYSILSGTSQLMGIFTIAAILAITNVQYIGSIRNK